MCLKSVDGCYGQLPLLRGLAPGTARLGGGVLLDALKDLLHRHLRERLVQEAAVVQQHLASGKAQEKRRKSAFRERKR